METSIVRNNLLNKKGYTPYCGNDTPRTSKNGCSNPRTHFDGNQFRCRECGWISNFPLAFIIKYKKAWNL